MITIVKIRSDSDTQLMQRVKDGDTEAIGKLYERNFSNVKRFFEQSEKANGYSEDLVHDVFMRILKKSKTFREDSTFKEFLNGYCRKVLQEHKHKCFKESKLAEKKAISQNQIDLFTPEKACLYAEQYKEIEMSKSRLSEKQRQAINSPKLDNKQTTCSNNTQRKRRFDARNKLKKLLKEKKLF